MPAPSGFVEALASYAEAIDDVAPLVAERDALFARMNNGEAGRVLTTAGVQHTTFAYTVSLTVEERFTAYVQAIKLFEGKTVPMTFAVFPYLRR